MHEPRGYVFVPHTVFNSLIQKMHNFWQDLIYDLEFSSFQVKFDIKFLPFNLGCHLRSLLLLLAPVGHVRNPQVLGHDRGRHLPLRQLHPGQNCREAKTKPSMNIDTRV